MRVYFNAFWGGFNEQTDAVHCSFFLDLFKRVWNEPIEIGDKESSDILCESIFGKTALFDKEWKYSILFSGESRLQEEKIDHLYSFVLYGQKNNKNRINCPLFLPYLYGNKFIKKIEENPIRTTIPHNAILVVITNPNGRMRNLFLENLEKYVPVIYAGHYKNNLGGIIQAKYYSQDFFNIVSQFKFILAMENSREETYITEKICHGFLGQSIPIYWGSPNIHEYFNKDRYVYLDSEKNIEDIIKDICDLMRDDTKWLSMVNQKVFVEDFNIEDILNKMANDINSLLNGGAKAPRLLDGEGV